MNVLHFSTNDSPGGAASAAYQLHKCMRDAGHLSNMIVRNKAVEDDDVKQIPLDRYYQLINIKRRLFTSNPVRLDSIFNTDSMTGLKAQCFTSKPAGSVDLICLHWITGLLTVKQIKEIYDHYKCPMTWTVMDQEPITGGCHYSYDCDGFTRQCGNCPQLQSPHSRDLSNKVWCRKNKFLGNIPLVMVAPTSWVARRIKQSSLFCETRTETIPLAIDTSIFRPFSKSAARNLLQVPQDKKVVYFGARFLHEERKGMAFLLQGLEQLAAQMSTNEQLLKREEIHLLIVGGGAEKLSLPFPSTYISYLKDNISLALSYQASDVFVCPSVEDAGPMMIPESMLCGTPVVAFNTGGAPDLIENMKTGYLANYKDSSDLARGIYSLLTISDLTSISREAHLRATANHAPKRVAERYLKLYDSLRAAVSKGNGLESY
jgi:glycosyltransferase involved in cell wall biosynthesis